MDGGEDDAIVVRLPRHHVLARELVEERHVLEKRRQRVVRLRELRELFEVVETGVAVGELGAGVGAPRLIRWG